MGTPEFVVVGHTARDIVAGGFRLGGTTTYAAAQAHRLGLSVGVVTSAVEELGVEAALPFAKVVRVPAEADTTFENVYSAGVRTQRILAVAPALQYCTVTLASLEMVPMFSRCRRARRASGTRQTPSSPGTARR